ncbi:MAG: transaldolase [Acidobacteriota bacterium]|nr:transaldolase [Acidobacteriota bacterium]
MKGLTPMPIFLDTADLKEIKRYHRMGLVRGVTTNPTIILKANLGGGMSALEAHAKEIASLIAPMPLSVEVTSNDPNEMLDQAQLFAAWADNIVVKVTIHGPAGELENLEVVHQLETVHDVRVNVTAMMSAQQCFLAAMSGATYVSIFGGRVNNMGYNACGEIKLLRELLDRFNLPAQIIVGSTREVLNVIEWLGAGAHIVTTVPSLLEGMLVHPYSKETVQMFLRDAAKADEVLKQPARAEG